MPGQAGEKYCTGGGSKAQDLLLHTPGSAARDLIGAAFTSSTWGKLKTALNCYLKFAQSRDIIVSYPFELENLANFTAWALTENGLKPSTVKSYLSALATIHKLRNVSDENFSNYIIKTIIRGAENLALYDDYAKETRKVMTLPLLKLIGHEIACSDWSDISKQIFWTCSLMAFFGSFRIGELLSCNKNSFVPKETLLWEDLTFRGEDSVMVKIKISKNRSVHGETVDLFKYEKANLCPVRALIRLRDLCKNYSTGDRPVFEFENGSLLTPLLFNNCVKEFLRPYIGDYADQITSHSFRAALPSAMGADPIACKSVELKQWGRWYSDSYLLYTRLKYDQKKALFYKIVNILNKLQG
jgi:hypothetical protein